MMTGLEALLEKKAPVLPPEIRQRALNCVHLLEVVNALVLDEARPMRAEERSRAVAALELLATCLANA